MYSYNQIQAAWQQVKSKGSDGGIDKQTIELFQQNLIQNLQRIQRKLNDKTYLPEAYLQIKIKKNKTEKRIIGLATINDKIVQNAIKNDIESKVETTFFNSSYAYREGRSARKAINKVRHYIISEKNHWLAKCDIDNFFDNIDHQRLQKQLKPYVKDDYILQLIMSFIKMGYVTHSNKWIERDKGVPQGAVLSPLLANLYLTPLDQRMHNKNIAYVRYADDFVMLAKTEQQANQILTDTVKYIQTKLKLNLNEGAFVKHTQYGFKYLGTWITDKSITLSSEKIERLKNKVINAFNHKSFPVKYFDAIQGINNYYARIIPQHILFPIDEAIIKMWKKILLKKNIRSKKQIKKQLENLRFVTDIYNQSKTFHINNIVEQIYAEKKQKQILTAEQAVKERRKIYEQKAVENSHIHIGGYGKYIGMNKKFITVKAKGKPKQKISIQNLQHITISGNAMSLSTNFIKRCVEKNIAIDFVNKKGEAVAKIYNYQSMHNQLWLRQLSAVNNQEGFSIAKKIAVAKINNQIKLIKYFTKYAKKTEKDILETYNINIQKLQSNSQKIKALKYNGQNQNDIIMGYEGKSSAIYWHWVKMMIDEETGFEKRTGYKATDTVNQMFNYAYGILYKLVWTSVIKHGLHHELGFLHAYKKYKASLIFDLIEPFRQPVADRAIISLINKKTKIQSENNLLTQDTKQKLINAVDKALMRYDKYNKERLAMMHIIDKQTQNLKNFLLKNDQKFKPYKTTKW